MYESIKSILNYGGKKIHLTNIVKPLTGHSFRSRDTEVKIKINIISWSLYTLMMVTDEK